MARREIRLAAILWALGWVWLPSAAAKDGWWNYDWPYRRAVTVADVPKTGLAGDEVGVVTMPTGGLIRPDGRDIRVAAADGTLTPHRVLMVGPGDKVRIAFALKPAKTRYFVYFGVAKAAKPDEQLKVRRGLMLETWAYGGGGITGYERMRKTFDRANKLLGRDFIDEVFIGHNPFGPQNRLCSLFTGYLVCKTDGEYTFATTSRDATFLLIDGKVVVDNGGYHRPRRRAGKQGKVTLTKGLHELKVYHVSTRGDPVVVAGWREPNGRRLWKIPASAFAPIRRATPGMITKYGQRLQADFIPDHAGETFMADKYFQRYTFAAAVTGGRGGRYEWDFGDSLKATGASAEHVYLRNGTFKVTLTVTLGGRKLTRTNRVYVSRPWDRVTASRLDPLADHARIVAGYDFDAIDARNFGSAVALLNRARQRKAVLRAGKALLKRGSAPAPALSEAMPIYADTLARKDVSAAIAALLDASKMTKAPAVRAALSAHAGEIALQAGQADRAAGIFADTIKAYASLTTHESIRRARIGLGDVERLRGDYAKALAAYKLARPVGKSASEKQAVRKGDLARHVQDYIRAGKFRDAKDFLDRWEWEFPVDKLEGYSTLLRATLAMARKKYPLAAEQAGQLLRVNPQSNYAAELLMLQFKAHKARGQTDLARRSLERIVKEYPESPLAAEAAKKLPGK